MFLTKDVQHIRDCHKEIMKYSSSGDVNSNSQGYNILSNTYNISKRKTKKKLEPIILNREIISPKIRLTIHRNVFNTENHIVISSLPITMSDILNYNE